MMIKVSRGNVGFLIEHTSSQISALEHTSSQISALSGLSTGGCNI